MTNLVTTWPEALAAAVLLLLVAAGVWLAICHYAYRNFSADSVRRYSTTCACEGCSSWRRNGGGK